MLWVNLIMDSLGSLALATEPPYDELLERKPTNKNESIINGRMWKHIVLQSIFEIGILLTLYMIAPIYITEYKKDLKTFAQNLEKCVDLPGDPKSSDKILYGTKEDWSTKKRFFYYCNDTGNYTTKFCSNLAIGEREIYDKTIFENYSLPNNFNFSGMERNYTDDNLQSFFKNYYLEEYGSTTHMTLIFDVFVIYTLFNQVNCRIIDDSFNTFKRISKGLLFCLVTLGELIIQVLLSQLGGIVFHCVSGGLHIYQWIICVCLAISTMIFNFIIKLIPLEKCIDPFTKGPAQQSAEKARTTINEMVNQNLKE
jgi:magnesium-transporting ATPase (P-type)